MQKIIEICREVINGEEVNSVNAREIHKYLEVKTKFNDWINRAMKKYDFIEGEDFLLTQKRVSGNNAISKEYIVTMDTAKELSMLENNKKGKETRKYFINVEKSYYDKKPKLETEMPHLMLKILESQQEQSKLMFEMLSEMKEQRSLPEQISSRVYIDSRSRKKMRDALSARAKEISQELGVSKDTIAPAMWIELKRFFDVDDYQDIHQEQVGAVMNWIMMYESVKERVHMPRIIA